MIAEKLGLLETEEPADAVDPDPNDAGDTAVDAAADDSDTITMVNDPDAAQ